jgi:hypothetical protein
VGLLEAVLTEAVQAEALAVLHNQVQPVEAVEAVHLQVFLEQQLFMQEEVPVQDMAQEVLKVAVLQMVAVDLEEQ